MRTSMNRHLPRTPVTEVFFRQPKMLGQRAVIAGLLLLVIGVTGLATEPEVEKPRLCTIALAVNESGEATISCKAEPADSKILDPAHRCQQELVDQNGRRIYLYFFNDPKALRYLSSPFGNPLNVSFNKENYSLRMQPAKADGWANPVSFIALPYRLTLPFEAKFTLAVPDESDGSASTLITLYPHHYVDNVEAPTHINIVISTKDRFTKSASVQAKALYPENAAKAERGLLAKGELTVADEGDELAFEMPLPVGANRKAFIFNLGAVGPLAVDLARLCVATVPLPPAGCHFQQFGESVIVSDLGDPSAARDAGLQIGDQVLKVNSREVFSRADAYEALALSAATQRAAIEVTRRGQLVPLELVLRERHQPPNPLEPAPGRGVGEHVVSLTVAEASALGGEKGALNLNHVTALSADVAEVLASHDRDLWLGGLTSLPPVLAKALAEHRQELILNGLATVSPEAAAELAKHKGGLMLNGLSSLSNDVARALAGHKGNLFLGGISTLAPDTAGQLANHEGFLYLGGLNTLSPELAKALGGHKHSLNLRGLKTLSEDSAVALAEHQADLSLEGLSAISPALITLAARHRGRLFLKGFTSLTAEDAKFLTISKSDGEIYFSGLDNLSEETVRTLASAKCVVSATGKARVAIERAAEAIKRLSSSQQGAAAAPDAAGYPKYRALAMRLFASAGFHVDENKKSAIIRNSIDMAKELAFSDDQLVAMLEKIADHGRRLGSNPSFAPANLEGGLRGALAMKKVR